MANERKLRLNGIARQFNVGQATLIEFLRSKGVAVEHGPNTIIEQPALEMVEKEFGKGKSVEKFNIREKIKAKNETVSLNDIHKTQSGDEGGGKDEVIVKSGLIEKTEVPVIQAPKVVGKIDLDGGTGRGRTAASRGSEEKRPAQGRREGEEGGAASASTVPGTVADGNRKADEASAPAVAAEAAAAQGVPEPANQSAPQAGGGGGARPVEIFRANEPERLSGPKIVGKIDLNTIEKKKSDSSDRNRKGKRKRIKKDNKVDINDAARNAGAGNAGGGASSSANRGGGRPGAGGPGGGGQGGRNRNAGGGKQRSGGAGSRPKPVVRQEVSDEDVQKQIKDTLARLTTKGNKSKSAKYRKDKREAVSARMNEEREREQQEKSILRVTEFVTVSELAQMMDVPVTEVITACMNLGLMVSINQRLDAEALVVVAEEFGYKVEFVTVEIQEAIDDDEDKPEDLVPRPPIVTVMGHVDHGKTSLLDFIRKANVIAGEAGGITQHIGAYSVALEDGKRITFLDTPGHEAFTAMRARGAKVTDVAIIIIAADDNVMPQTVEAINHASAAGVPIVFAINKIDKPGANPEKIKEELANMNYLVEDWGGKYQCQEIAAKKGTNVEKLLEKVVLEADLLELKANPDRKAAGTVIESSLDKGRGYVATVLVQTGTLHVGDVMLSGSHTGRVKAMFNERGKRIEAAPPSTPVLVLGLNGAPQAGDNFNVMDDDKQAREIANKREQLQRMQGLRTQKHITLDEIGRRIAIGNFQELNIIVKGDVDGSVEALTDSLIKLSKDEVQVNVIHKAVGQISESDVLLAAASNAVIIGFQVRPSASARRLAEKEEIEIRLYSIIYDAINQIKDAIEGMLAPEMKEEIVCSVEVLETFKITKVGTVAGCIVREGKLTRNTKIRVIRDGIVVYTGKLGSLKRFKDDVKEVVAGMECGLNIENYNDIKVGDIIEGYEEVEVKRK